MEGPTMGEVKRYVYDGMPLTHTEIDAVIDGLSGDVADLAEKLGTAESDYARLERERDELLARPLQLPANGAYIIRYDDTDKPDEFFAMTGARDGAFNRYRQISGNWNAHLYAKIDSNSRDAEGSCPSASYSDPAELTRLRAVEAAAVAWLGYELTDEHAADLVEALAEACGRKG